MKFGVLHVYDCEFDCKFVDFFFRFFAKRIHKIYQLQPFILVSFWLISNLFFCYFFLSVSLSLSFFRYGT